MFLMTFIIPSQGQFELHVKTIVSRERILSAFILTRSADNKLVNFLP